jgi:phosphoglycerol geranylgeranyltransferase
MNFFYLEAGSGANKPVPSDMIKAVKSNIQIPLIVGGGIRNVKTAKEIALAGADIIVTGTTLEKDKNLNQTLIDIINALEI